MDDVITFDEALRRTEGMKRILLLGNGFSIACKSDIFTYRSLLEQADFGAMLEVGRVFNSLGVSDFELVIKTLQDTATVMGVYCGECSQKEQIGHHSSELKNILADTIASKHPDFPSNIEPEAYASTVGFLSNFIAPGMNGVVYTLNYDLLLYWALMSSGNALEYKDGFGREDGDGYVVWQGERLPDQNIHYLHGALHLFDTGTDIKKFTWNDTGKRLIDQIREAMDGNMYPLFVAEGSSEQKEARIKHSGYLYHSFKSFSQRMNGRDTTLFIYGHSLAQNDKHILEKISKGKLSQVYVSVFGGIEANQSIVQSANQMNANRADSRYPLDIIYYDAQTAGCWSRV